MKWAGRSRMPSSGSVLRRGVSIPTAEIPYDREDKRQVAPYPDDYWLATNPSDPTEHKLRVQMSGIRTLRPLVDECAREWCSRIRRIQPGCPHHDSALGSSLDSDSVPQTPEQSLDPLASVGLFDVTPGSSRIRIANPVSTGCALGDRSRAKGLRAADLPVGGPEAQPPLRRDRHPPGALPLESAVQSLGVLRGRAGRVG